MQTFNVEKMMCGGCVASATKAIEALDGVDSVEVDLEAKQAKVGGSVSADAVIAALTSAGYPTTLAE